MDKNKKTERASGGEVVKAEPIKNPDTGMASILGDVSFLMLHSQAHRHLFISDMEWLVIPALRLKQMRVFRDAKKPVAYISWAALTEETEARLLSGNTRLAPREWNAGKRIWIIDSICSAPSIYPFFKSVNDQVFKGQEVRLVTPKKNSRGLEGVLLAEVLAEMEKKIHQGAKH
jgi:cytolysin-activating lysine-acyltransferase